MKEDVIITQEPAMRLEGSGLLDMRRLNKEQLEPANHILNQTNFYTLMENFTPDPTVRRIRLLFSPTVERDLSIFDHRAIQSVIRCDHPFASLKVPNYDRSSLMWVYDKHDVDDATLQTLRHPRLFQAVTAVFATVAILWMLSMVVSVVMSSTVYFGVGSMTLAVTWALSACMFPVYGQLHWDAAALDRCPLVDYTGV